MRGPTTNRGFGRAILLGILASLVLPASASAQAYEPNDTPGSAFGPLSNGQQLFALLESNSDEDWYSFYVAKTSSTTFTFQTLDPAPPSGGYDPCGFGLNIHDAKSPEYPILEKDFVDNDFESDGCHNAVASGTFVNSLKQGKYYVMVQDLIQIRGDMPYALTATSGISSLAEVQAGCDSRTSKADASQRKADKLKGKVKNAKSKSQKRKAKKKYKAAKAAAKSDAKAAKRYCKILTL